jgi:hypothetical protein
MRVRGNGFWEIFVPEARAGDKYKYEIVGPDGHLLPLKSDPLAFAAELRPRTASIVVDRETIQRPQAAPGGIIPFSLTTSTPFIVALSLPSPDGTNVRSARRHGRSLVISTSPYPNPRRPRASPPRVGFGAF